jgi:hypothetical protein
MQYDWRRLVTELAPYSSGSGECSAESAIQVILRTFEQFAAEDTQSFKGSVHCEAYLASLMRSEEVPEHIRREFEASSFFFRVLDIDLEITTTQDVDQSVMGTSTRCCLVCTHLLEILSPASFDRTNVCGSHYTIYPCALPPCLPFEVIQRMVDDFETVLKDSLRALTARPLPDLSS